VLGFFLSVYFYVVSPLLISCYYLAYNYPVLLSSPFPYQSVKTTTLNNSASTNLFVTWIHYIAQANVEKTSNPLLKKAADKLKEMIDNGYLGRQNGKGSVSSPSGCTKNISYKIEE